MRRLDQTAQPILYHPADIPAHRIYEEKPSRIPDFAVDVLAATIVFSVVFFLGCYSFYKYFWPGGVTAIVTLFFFVWRVNRIFDNPIAHIKDSILQDAVPRVPTPPQGIPVNAGGRYQGEIQRRNDKTLRHDGREYVFTGRMLDRMLAWVDKGIDSIRREPSGEYPGLNELGINGTAYTTAVYVLEHNGLIHKRGGTYYWTVAGKEWLETV